jgi:hypothetical protein
MVVKYQDGDAWGFIDNVRQASYKEIDLENLADKYFNEPKGQNSDPAEWCNGIRLPDNVVTSNKAFIMATDIPDEGINRHSENLIDNEHLNMPAATVLIYLEDCKEYDAVQLVTNQKVFLLNDKGQTIERLN